MFVSVTNFLTSGVNNFVVGLEIAYFLAVLEDLDTHAVSLLGGRVKQRNIGDVQGHFDVPDTTGLTHIGVRLDMLLGDIAAFYHDAVIRLDYQHGATLAFVFTGNNDDIVTFSDLTHY